VRKPHKYSVNIPAKTYQPNVLVLFLKKYWPWISLTLIILFTVSIRIRLLQIPLERDEGEFAYMGQLMLQGIPPYLLAYNMKFPGIYALYALIMAAFGQTIIGIHLGLLVFNTAAIVLLFLLARRLFDDLTSVVSASVYALLSLSPTVCGTAAHATQFIVPFVLAATLLLLHALDKGKYWMIFASGFLYGLAFIIKQHAAFFVIFAVLYFITDSLRKNRMDWKRPLIGTFILISASVIPFIISCLLLYITGAFQKFWFWTITYAHQYVSLKPLSGVPREFIDHLYLVMYSGEILWAMAGLGLTGIFWDKKIKANWIFLTGLSFFIPDDHSRFLLSQPLFHNTASRGSVTKWRLYQRDGTSFFCEGNALLHPGIACHCSCDRLDDTSLDIERFYLQSFTDRGMLDDLL